MVDTSESTLLQNSPPSSEQMIEDEVTHRLGQSRGRSWKYTTHSLKRAIGVSSDGLIHWNSREARISCLRLRGVPNRPAVLKGKIALKEANDCGLDFDVLIDMQDARSDDPALRKAVAPILCFNRLSGATGRVLWPMAHIHSVGSSVFAGDFGGADAVPFLDRKDKFVWRGSINGKSTAERREISVRTFLRKSIHLKPDEVLAGLKFFARVDFVSRFIDHEVADIGLSTGNEAPALRPLIRTGLTQAQMASNRYIVVLPGADLATSFFWTMASGSLGLVVEHDWESFASVHFRPWEHFLPVKRDLSDFEEVLRWARSNPDKCADMAGNAQSVMAILNDQTYRDKTNRCVLDGLRQRLGFRM